MRELEHFVGGKSVAGTSGRHGPVFDPARGVQTGTVPLADAAEIDDAVASRQGRGGRVGSRLAQLAGQRPLSPCATWSAGPRPTSPRPSPPNTARS